MSLKFLKFPPTLIALAVVPLTCFLEIGKFSFAQRLEWMTYDWRVKIASRFHDPGTLATNLGFVEINDQTIAAVKSGDLGFSYGLYWPRLVYGRAVRELSRDGAKAVAFDVLFSERRPDHDTLSPPDDPSIGSDASFAKELRQAGNVILAADKGLLPDRLFLKNARGIGNISVQRDADGVLRRDKAFEDYRVWHPFVQQAAAEFGFALKKTILEPGRITFVRNRGDETVSMPLDGDGNIATTNFANPLPDGVPEKFHPWTTRRVWSMGIALAAEELNLDLDHARIEPGRIVLQGRNGLTREIPIDDNGCFYVNWEMEVNHPALQEGSLQELLAAPLERAAGKPAPNHWKDKLVMIGSTATGNDLADVGATPLGNETYLVSKHWNVANSILTGRFITVPSRFVRLALIAALGFFSAWITWIVTRPLTGSLVMILIGVAYLTLAYFLFAQWRFWLPVVLPLGCAGIVTHICAVTYRVGFEQTERKRVKQFFSRLVSPNVVNELLKDRELSLVGTRREITVFFADVRGFTELSDMTQARAEEHVREHRLGPREAEAYFDAQAKDILDTIKLYLVTVADTVIRNNGTLDKYIGDCTMAFWGAPVPNPRHALECVRAAIEAQQAIHALNRDREAVNRRRETENAARARTGQPPVPLLPVLSLGSGINTGVAIAGLMGSEKHVVNYTVFGREVNLAARLEGVSGKSRILIGEGTHLALLRDDPQLAAACVPLPPVNVKGFRVPVKIYEVPWQVEPVENPNPR